MNLRIIAPEDTRVLMDAEQRKEAIRRIRLNMIPDGPTETIDQVYYDTVDDRFFGLTSSRPEYSMRLRVVNGNTVEFRKEYDGIMHARTVTVECDAEEWLSRLPLMECDSWEEWDMKRVLGDLGPLIRRFRISFKRDCWIEKKEGDTVVAIDSEIMLDGEPLFGEGISLLRIESPHKHPLWAVRMLEALDPDDRDVSLYRTGVERCQRLS